MRHIGAWATTQLKRECYYRLYMLCVFWCGWLSFENGLLCWDGPLVWMWSRLSLNVSCLHFWVAGIITGLHTVSWAAGTWSEWQPRPCEPLAKRNIFKFRYCERTTSWDTWGWFRCSLVFCLNLFPGRSGKKKRKKVEFLRGSSFCVILWGTWADMFKLPLSTTQP